MKIGMCADATGEAIQSCKNVGFDYIEMPLKNLILLDKKEIVELGKASSDIGLPIEVCNFFAPAEVRLTEPNYSAKKLLEYCERSYEILAELDVEILVVGSGKSRNFAQDADPIKGMELLKQSYTIIAEAAVNYDFVVVLEHLNKKECNNILLVSEAAEICRELNHPKLQLLADVYHMRLENEPMQVIVDNQDIMKHLHLCGVTPDGKRCMPHKNDGYDYKPFTDAICRAGYNARISLEVFNINIEKEAPFGLELCRNLFPKS